MAFAYNRVINLEDFREPTVRATICEVFAREATLFPGFPVGREQRKQWEIAMAVLALRDGGALRPDADILGIGAGAEATIFWLTNHARRVWATDLYATPGAWESQAPPAMLTAPETVYHEPWQPRRLVVQHMDACQLAYEDESFDGIFSSGSIEHFGSLEAVGSALDEAFRVLKPGGIASFSTEYLISGDPLAFEDQTIMFTEELIDRVIRGQRDWSLMAPIDYTISPATLATEIDIDEYLGRPEPTYPHCVLRIGDNVLTSVHIAFRKAAPAPVDRSPSVVAARPSPSAPAPSGDTQHSRVSTSARRQRLMQLLRWLLRRPYHPLLWRLERNHQQSLALEARLAELSQRLDRSTERFDRQLADVGQISRRASQSAREAVEVAKAGTEANRTTLAEWAAVIARTVRQRGRGD